MVSIIPANNPSSGEYRKDLADKLTAKRKWPGKSSLFWLNKKTWRQLANSLLEKAKKTNNYKDAEVYIKSKRSVLIDNNRKKRQELQKMHEEELEKKRQELQKIQEEELEKKRQELQKIQEQELEKKRQEALRPNRDKQVKYFQEKYPQLFSMDPKSFIILLEWQYKYILWELISNFTSTQIIKFMNTIVAKSNSVFDLLVLTFETINGSNNWMIEIISNQDANVTDIDLENWVLLLVNTYRHRIWWKYNSTNSSHLYVYRNNSANNKHISSERYDTQSGFKYGNEIKEDAKIVKINDTNVVIEYTDGNNQKRSKIIDIAEWASLHPSNINLTPEQSELWFAEYEQFRQYIKDTFEWKTMNSISNIWASILYQSGDFRDWFTEQIAFIEDEYVDKDLWFAGIEVNVWNSLDYNRAQNNKKYYILWQDGLYVKKERAWELTDKSPKLYDYVKIEIDKYLMSKVWDKSAKRGINDKLVVKDAKTIDDMMNIIIEDQKPLDFNTNPYEWNEYLSDIYNTYCKDERYKKFFKALSIDGNNILWHGKKISVYSAPNNGNDVVTGMTQSKSWEHNKNKLAESISFIRSNAVNNQLSNIQSQWKELLFKNKEEFESYNFPAQDAFLKALWIYGCWSATGARWYVVYYWCNDDHTVLVGNDICLHTSKHFNSWDFAPLIVCDKEPFDKNSQESRNIESGSSKSIKHKIIIDYQNPQKYILLKNQEWEFVVASKPLNRHKDIVSSIWWKPTDVIWWWFIHIDPVQKIIKLYGKSLDFGCVEWENKDILINIMQKEYFWYRILFM